MRIEARPITDPDAALLVEEVQQEYIARYGGRDETPLDTDEFNGTAGLFFVGYVDDEPVATGAWRWHEDVAEAGQGPSVEIKRMYVAASHRGNGYARAMLGHLENTASVSGARVIILETGTMQPEAISLYESSGYLSVPDFGFYRDSPMSRCYAKSLT